MMMTSGNAVKYKNWLDAGRQIAVKEGPKALFAGGAANILRGVAGAGVLALYDKCVAICIAGLWVIVLMMVVPQVPGACVGKGLRCRIWLRDDGRRAIYPRR